MIHWVEAADAKNILHQGIEIAFLDVREAGQFADGHPLFAIPCPFSRLEGTVVSLVPRMDVPVLLIDQGDGIAQRAAATLLRMGYTDVSAISGGVQGWAEAGFTLFKGVNVPSKTLGELVEHRFQPRSIDAQTLASWREEGRPVQLFDCRPPAEYAKMRIPGAVCLPNGELAHRFDVAVSSGGPVVVTCAGRTRSLIGSAGLWVAGLRGEIYALENGTQGWALAGHALERGNSAQSYPPLTQAARAVTKDRAAALLTKEGLPLITAQTASQMRAQSDRTTYFFDMRSAAEVASDPLAAFTPALSGQLVQATDQWVGVRHARLVLADDLGLRAAIAAYWLRALGFEVFVLLVDDDARQIPPLPAAAAVPLPKVAHVDARVAVSDLQEGRARLVDFRPSDLFRASHLAGAIWGLRPRLGAIRKDPDHPLYVIAGTEAEAALMAGDLLDAGHAQVAVVSGGFAALTAAGGTTVTQSDLPDRREAIDFTWFAHGRHDGDLEASRLYLDWEQGLIAQLDPEERAAFRL
jgi:rhodanese-related sulfurtransferase